MAIENAYNNFENGTHETKRVIIAVDALSIYLVVIYHAMIDKTWMI